MDKNAYIKTRLYDTANKEYPAVSETMLGALERYLINGISPGGFLTSVLENDLMGAMDRADSYNTTMLKDICGLIYNGIPSGAWGSAEKVENYMANINNSEGIEG